MLNDEDINKLIKAFGEVFTTKEDFYKFQERNQKNFSGLILFLEKLCLKLAY